VRLGGSRCIARASCGVIASLIGRLVQVASSQQIASAMVAMGDCVIASGVHRHLRWHGPKGSFQGSGRAVFDDSSRWW
jgi:hypothetical protein